MDTSSYQYVLVTPPPFIGISYTLSHVSLLSSRFFALGMDVLVSFLGYGVNGSINLVTSFSPIKANYTIPLSSMGNTSPRASIFSGFSDLLEGGDILHNLRSKHIVSMIEGLSGGLGHFPIS